MAASYQLQCEFLESQVEKDVARYLGALTILTGEEFRLLDCDEGVTGADGVVHWRCIPFFFQFKRPIGLKSTSSCPLPAYPRKGESALQDIRRFRNSNNLKDAPHSLAFELRRLARNAQVLQHNLLHQLHVQGHWAVYVCPTHLSLVDYTNDFSTGIQACPQHRPFTFKYRRPSEAAQNSLLTASYFAEACPFLKSHISINPHKIVSTHEHHYSFSTIGDDLAFHSPEVVTQKPRRLDEYISTVFKLTADGISSQITVANFAQKLQRENQYIFSKHGLPEVNEGREARWLMKSARVLKHYYGIRQMIFAIK